jgi:hypothetical protein
VPAAACRYERDQVGAIEIDNCPAAKEGVLPVLMTLVAGVTEPRQTMLPEVDASQMAKNVIAAPPAHCAVAVGNVTAVLFVRTLGFAAVVVFQLVPWGLAGIE